MCVLIDSHAALIFSLDLDDLHFKKRAYDGNAAYANSKLANILFVKELAKRLKVRLPHRRRARAHMDSEANQAYVCLAAAGVSLWKADAPLSLDTVAGHEGDGASSASRSDPDAAVPPPGLLGCRVPVGPRQPHVLVRVEGRSETPNRCRPSMLVLECRSETVSYTLILFALLPYALLGEDAGAGRGHDHLCRGVT